MVDLPLVIPYNSEAVSYDLWSVARLYPLREGELLITGYFADATFSKVVTVSKV